MSEPWQRKSYYRHRVLIEVDRVLSPGGEDSLVCITAGQLEMLRNLTQYLHRRSTFVREHKSGFYYAPTEAEWDDIDALVADLEETLMGCDTITAALLDIAAQLSCLCLSSEHRPTYSPITGDIVDHFVDDGKARHDNPYPATTVVDGDRCAVAQLVWQGAWEWLTEIILPAVDASTDLLIPAVMVLIAAWVGPAVFIIPTGVLLAALWNLIEVWEDGEFTNTKNAFVSFREEIICALYHGLLIDAQTAASNAKEVIWSTSLATGDKICLTVLCGPWMIAAAKLAWAEPTAWATANVTANYCDVCEELETGVEFTWTWPPCPATHHTDGGVCYGAPLVLCFNGDIDDAHQQHVATAGTYNRITLECRFRSKFGAAWTVGWLSVERWDSGLETWVQIAALSLDTDQAAGNLNTVLDTFTQDPVVPGGLYRSVLEGADGQHDTEPYPLAVEYARVKYELIPPP